MCKTSHFFTRVNVGPLCSVFTYHVRCIIRVRNYVLSNNSRLPIFCFKLIAGFDPTATGFGLRACLLCWTLTSCLLPLSGFPARARPLPTRSGPNAPAKSRSVRFSFWRWRANHRETSFVWQWNSKGIPGACVRWEFEEAVRRQK